MDRVILTLGLIWSIGMMIGCCYMMYLNHKKILLFQKMYNLEGDKNG